MKCFIFIFQAELAKLSTILHENPSLEVWEEVKSDLSGYSATNDDLGHVNQISMKLRQSNI